jgi:hypothetical protein
MATSSLRFIERLFLPVVLLLIVGSILFGVLGFSLSRVLSPPVSESMLTLYQGRPSYAAVFCRGAPILFLDVSRGVRNTEATKQTISVGRGCSAQFGLESGPERFGLAGPANRVSPIIRAFVNRDEVYEVLVLPPRRGSGLPIAYSIRTRSTQLLSLTSSTSNEISSAWFLLVFCGVLGCIALFGVGRWLRLEIADLIHNDEV